MAQLIKDFKEMPHVPSNSVERRNKHHVKSPSSCISDQSVKAWTLRFRTTNYVAVLAHNFKSSLFSQLAQVKELSFKVLISRAHTGVNNRSFHGYFFSFFLNRRSL